MDEGELLTMDKMDRIKDSEGKEGDPADGHGLVEKIQMILYSSLNILYSDM